MLSPDVTKITFASDRNGDDYDVYVMDADGSDVTRVTRDAGVNMDADWQPLPRTVHQPDTGVYPSCWWRAYYSYAGVSPFMRR